MRTDRGDLAWAIIHHAGAMHAERLYAILYAVEAAGWRRETYVSAEVSRDAAQIIRATLTGEDTTDA